MIIEGQIINRPYSGEYEERIYDNNSPWNSQGWTYSIRPTKCIFYERLIIPRFA